jgi:hypothetical protein
VSETKGFLASARAASESELLKQVLAGDGDGFASKVEGVESGRIGVIGNSTTDPGYQCVRLDNRAKHRIAGSLLSPNLHFLAIFLVHESESDIGRC